MPVVLSGSSLLESEDTVAPSPPLAIVAGRGLGRRSAVEVRFATVGPSVADHAEAVLAAGLDGLRQSAGDVDPVVGGSVLIVASRSIEFAGDAVRMLVGRATSSGSVDRLSIGLVAVGRAHAGIADLASLRSEVAIRGGLPVGGGLFVDERELTTEQRGGAHRLTESDVAARIALYVRRVARLADAGTALRA